MSTPELGFVHRFVPASDPDRPPLLLLHGTGGDESDLLPLAERVAPGSALLSPRGKVLEDGMPRFFRRYADGRFDMEDLRLRSHELADFVERARAAYGIDKPIALGFSNGANIATYTLLSHPDLFAGALLIRATTAAMPRPLPELKGLPVLLLSGRDDAYSSPEKREQLPSLLREAGANLRHEIVPTGHGLSAEDLAIAEKWLSART
ncbi:MAG TPA: alpha/beta hydrolase [Xanthobacteraceae bacterium]|nr:alpha/beta hydrolase [Xanthobacteraceae bacterium]